MRRAPSFQLVLAAILVAALLLAALAPSLIAGSPDAVDVTRRLAPPSAAFPFGTDETGRDVFARVVHGTRTTLGVVGSALALAALTGGLLGMIAGFTRGVPDLAVSRLADAVLAFPPIVLGVVIAGTLGAGIPTLVLGLALIYAPAFFRVARAAALTEAGLAYVEAARVLGHSETATLFRHVARNVVPTVALQAVILFPLALQISAALGFLGLGVQPPTPDWGASLQESRNYVTTAPWLAIFPGLALLLASLAASLLGRVLSARG